MRVIAGEVGGTNLKSIDTKSVRPTLGRVKESMFSMIFPYFPFEKGLDLFAGFGSLGIEALSRGTKQFTFIEKNRKYAKLIKENIKKCHFEKRSKVRTKNVFTYLKNCKEKYDIIFLDPPYKKNLVNKTLQSLINNKILNDKALIIVEHHNEEKIKNYDKLKILKDRSYSKTVIKVYLYEEE